MKNVIISISISILMVCLISCQKQIENGLVAHYPFDGDASNQIGEGNDGNVGGVSLVDDRFGNENSAYFFDGVDDTIFVEVTGMPNIEAPQSFSWWYWVSEIPTFSDAFGAGNMIAMVNPESGVGIQFGFRGQGYETLGLDGWNWGGNTLLEADPPAVNVWHFCVYTFDGSTHRFYIDGAETASSTATTQQGSPSILMFGNYPSGDQYFAGRLDDVRIYNRALKVEEIQSLYSAKE